MIGPWGSLNFGPLAYHCTDIIHVCIYHVKYTVPATGNVKMKCVRMRLVAKLKRVCVHHAQVMLGTVERSKHDFY